MKKLLLKMLILITLTCMLSKINSICAQGLTVPDYSYVSVYATSAVESQTGITDPGPYGNYSLGEIEHPFGIFYGHGYRWWGYPTAPLLICGDFPLFNFPGFHGIYDLTSLGCSNPPIGFMASFGSVITDPDTKQIWCLAGAANQNGPFTQYCIPNPFGSGQICYPPSPTWGFGSAYGYMRKVVVVQSTGALETGDEVDIKATLAVQGVYDGDDWDALSRGVLFLNKMSDTSWLGGEWYNDYLKWGDVEDILGTPGILNSMLGHMVVELNSNDDISTSVKVGDTIIVEVAFNNTIQHSNPGGSDYDDGWAGERPSLLFGSLNFGTTSTIKPLIKDYGNRLDYDLLCLTAGAVLEPVNPDGPNLEEDMDGISDTREKGANGNDSSFDGNGDGTPDWEQANVASFLTYDAQNYVTLIVPEGVDLSEVTVTSNPSPADTPEDAEFPFGFFDFSIDDLTPGDAVTVTLILHNAPAMGKYYKYGITPDDLTKHWYEFTYDGQTGAQINGNEITLDFVDGL